MGTIGRPNKSPFVAPFLRGAKDNSLITSIDLNLVRTDDLPDHMSMHVCQAALDAIVVEAELFVVQPEQMQGCGVQIVGPAGVFCGLKSGIVGGT